MNDIIIEFAESYYTQDDYENNRIPANKINAFLAGEKVFKQYHVVTGSVFSNCYNETLDSATVLLSQIPLYDRLTKIKPYLFCCVYHVNESGTLINRHTYLVDNYNEVEDNIRDHIFSYTINLMSETKLLEKIQIPNRAVTHKVVNGQTSKKTIWQLIKENMDLYCPKVKFTENGVTWSYKPIITVPTSGDFYTKFNSITSADLPLTAPTMRQLLTTLMQQIGCIPTVNDGVLGYLDFQKDAQEFGDGDYKINDTVNKVTRSLSSDSFANTLVDMSSQVLDSGNEVICETLGFRDKENILLKQQENLKLETKFPIYKVNKFSIKNFMGISSNKKVVRQTWQNKYVPGVGDWDGRVENALIMDIEFLHETHTIQGVDYHARISIRVGGSEGGKLPTPITQGGVSYEYWGWHFTHLKVHCCKHDGTDVKEVGYFDENTSSSDIYVEGTRYGLADFHTFTVLTTAGEDNQTQVSIYLKNDVVGADVVWVEGNAVPELQNYSGPGFSITRVDYANYLSDSNYVNNEYEKTGSYICIYRGDYLGTMDNQIAYIRGAFKLDITPLLVENSIRNNLNNNFKEMSSNSNIDTIDELSRYIYGTVGYSIGSTSISGFSSTYTQGSATFVGWWVWTYTYIENILSFLERNYSSNDLEIQYAEYAIDNYPLKADITDPDIANLEIGSAIYNYSYLLFDLYYQPLNSFNLSFVKKKEDVDFSIEQLNSAANGVTDFDRLAIHQQEQVDRIGNETLIIHQRTQNFEDIQQDFANGPYYFLDSRDGVYDEDYEKIKHVVFKVEYSVNNFYYEVSYTAAKDNILKNYFTSIRTKYRAYQYVDYNQSTLRKENHTVFVRLGENYYNGDDNIRLGDWSKTYNSADYLANLQYFVDGIEWHENPNTIKAIYEKEHLENYSYKNEISIVATTNSFAIIYQDFENASPGVWLSPRGTQDLGGIPQGWYLFDDNFNNHPYLFYCYKTSFLDLNLFFANSNLSLHFAAQYLPKDEIVTDSFLTTEDNFVALTLCDDNSVQNISDAYLTTYKDDAEQIQRTLQFIYYSDCDDIKWSEHFIRNCSYVGSEDFIETRIIKTNLSRNFENWISDDVKDDHFETFPLEDIVSIDLTGEVPCIKVNWGSSSLASDITMFKVVGVYEYLQGSTTESYADIIGFKRPSSDFSDIKSYYITLNDTKSDWVMARASNNILYRKQEVKKDTLYRVLIDEFIYMTGTLPAGVASLVCHLGSVSGTVVNDLDVLNLGDDLYFVATANTGYDVNISSIANPLTVANNVIGANYVISTLKRYTLSGISSNGTVNWYQRTSESAGWNQVTSALYGSSVKYEIVPDEGYDAPEDHEGILVVNENNFTLSAIGATKHFDPCVIQTFEFEFILGEGVANVMYSIDNGTNWIPVTGTQTITFNYNTVLKWYATSTRYYNLVSGTPDSAANAESVIIKQDYDITVSATPRTYRLNAVNAVDQSSNIHGTVVWYQQRGDIMEIITDAVYGTTVKWQIVSVDTGYRLPSTTTGTLPLDDSHFTFVNLDAYLDINPCVPIAYTYTQGTLPTGVASITCYRTSSPDGGASIGTISSGTSIYINDTLYWTVVASTGYSAYADYDSSSNTLSVTGNVIGANYVYAVANNVTITFRNNSSATITLSGGISATIPSQSSWSASYAYGTLIGLVTASNSYGSDTVNLGTVTDSHSYTISDVTSTVTTEQKITGGPYTALLFRTVYNFSCTASTIGASSTQQANWTRWVAKTSDPAAGARTYTTNTATNLAGTFATTDPTTTSIQWDAEYYYNETTTVISGVSIT